MIKPSQNKLRREKKEVSLCRVGTGLIWRLIPPPTGTPPVAHIQGMHSKVPMPRPGLWLCYMSARDARQWDWGPSSTWAVPAASMGPPLLSAGLVPASHPGPHWQPQNTEAQGLPPRHAQCPPSSPRPCGTPRTPSVTDDRGQYRSWARIINGKTKQVCQLSPHCHGSAHHCTAHPGPQGTLLLDPPQFSAESDKSTKSTQRGW